MTVTEYIKNIEIAAVMLEDVGSFSGFRTNPNGSLNDVCYGSYRRLCSRDRFYYARIKKIVTRMGEQ